MQGDFQGLQELILRIMTYISEFDIKDFNTDFFAPILDVIAPVFNPVMEWFTEILNSLTGF